MKQRLGIALLFVFVLGVIGFQSRAAATEYDNSEGLTQASNSRSNPLSIETTDWERALVDPDGSWGVSLALDSANMPHISYYAQEEHGQTPATWKYATQQDGAWNTEQVVDPSAFVAANAASSSLILDRSNSPHIAFGLFSTSSSPPYPMVITHAFKQAETWEFEEVEVIEDTCAGPYVTLLLDSSGGLHLFYTVSVIDGTACRSILKYARQGGTNSWQVSTLVEGNVSAPSVVIDKDDNFHLAYTSHDETSSLHYSKFNAVAQFSPATIFTAPPEAQIYSPSIALDSLSATHIAFAYYQPYGYSLFVAHQGATEWGIDDSGKKMGSSSDINSFVDVQDNLHIYAGNTYGFNTVVEHYYKTQDEWQAEEIGAPASDISFVLDSSENVQGAAIHFSYGTESNWSLWYYHKLGDALTYTISGRVTTQSGTPIPGVVIGTATDSSTTDADGNYTITDLPTGTHNVSATLPGYSFAPSKRSVSVPPNAASQDFVGTPDAMTDTDGDGLLDDWELNGYRHANGDIVDLPAMGASAFKPDIFVEVDWMEGHRPKDEAIQRIVRSFANAPVYDETGNQISTGINLHVDVGPESIDYVTVQLWGANGMGNSISEIEEITNLDEKEGLNAINQIITNEINRSEARKNIFHYSVWISRLWNGGAYRGGISFGVQGNEPVFFVALGGSTNGLGSVSEQAGTFMHELGHNLGLDHGGQLDSVNHKPNYLSVMNYYFQEGGLIINGVDGDECGYECFDYSRFELPPLDEAELYENVGLNGGDEANPYGTKFRGNPPWLCVPFEVSNVFYSLVKENANSKVDWSCNWFIDSSPVQEDVTGDGGNAQVLTGYNDWLNLDFNYAHRFLRPQLGAQAMHVYSNNIEGIDPSLAIEELSLEEARAIPRISETRVQITASAHPDFVVPLDTLTYTVTAYTVDLGTIQSFVPIVNLPDSFSYIPNSTSGDISANPVISGNQLTWPSIEISDAATLREFSFQVRIGATEGLFSTDFSGISSTNLVISDQVEVRVQREPLERLLLPIIVH